MWDNFKDVIGLLVIAAGVIASHVRLQVTQSRQIEDHEELKQMVERNSSDIDDLKEERTRTSTMLENVIKMQEETRLDVKAILQNIATLAANQNKSKDNK
jgi:predicted secreted protein